ncbi:TonB-dependent receptor domain-containing protein [Allosphingosinicella sp.]|uniref:TonB-dependent receptor domain-containing protein n=1 Tax=Allosphingosinicella sp. TaxID=2823234 RepID=UPI002F105F11
MVRIVKSSFAATASSGALIVAGMFAAAPALAQDNAAEANPARAAAPAPLVLTATSLQPDVAQQDPAAPDAETAAATAEDEEIVVTGFRASLQNALGQKRRSDQIIDAITAEDIADFPDANLAESIQRLPGVSIDRDNGEGRSITVRGLGGDFQMTRLNGADALSVAGGNQSDAGANRTRGFDFNTFASELFSNIRVTKTTAAVNDEGSLGAIIDLTTGRPLAYRDNRYLIGLEGEYRENGSTWNPRFTALISHRVTDNFGLLASIAYQEQSQQIDAYRRSIGAFEYTYRNSQLAGVNPPTFGFARPGGTGLTFGSNPAAYALITPTTIIPALPSITRQDLSYDRLGATATAQWRPSSGTEVILDGVYSRYRQDSVVSGITTVGLNRNGTNTRVLANTLRAPNTANGLADRLALYPRCIPSATIDCGGTTLVTGTRDSFNPRNLNPFDYYNATISPGFVATPNQTGFHAELVGRPNTQVREAHVNEHGQADYLVLDNVDWRSSADAQFGETQFYQGTLNLTHDFTQSLSADATIGYSRSEFRGTGLLAEFNAIDRDNYTFDERGDGIMPVMSPGFDVADPNQWSLVKGLSTIRAFNTMVDNEFRVARLNFAYEVNDEFTLRFGGTAKQFDFASDQARRSQDIEAVNPTLLEAGLTSTDLGRTIGFGQGLTVSAGTPTSMFVPDLDAFRREFGIDCNCVNEWADFRAVPDGRQRNAVRERDMSGFFQLDFNVTMFGRPLRGNGGLRVAHTRVTGQGNVGGTDGVLGIPVTASHDYWDALPSFNANWEASDDFLIRFAASQTISRPQLASLTPGTTSFASGLNAAGAAPAITVGNPYLSPFRSTNFDLSFERYFGRNGLVAVTLFHKDLASFPQQIAGEAPLSTVFEPEIYDQLVAAMTSPTLRAYTLAGGVWAIRQFQDAPGGTIKGVEVNVQTGFGFIAPMFENFGITANFTHIESSLNYLTGTVLATRQGQTGSTAANSFAEGPFLNTSPDAFNATLYYEDETFSARVSGAYRERYVNRFPLASGTCSVGTTTNAGGPCNSPVIADFGYTENTLNIDAAMSLNVTDYLRLTLEGRNLTNTATHRTMYEASPVTQTYQSTGRVITAGARLTF